MKLKTMFAAFAFVALSLSLGSCKKDWTCTCTSGSLSASSTIHDQTKSDAKEACAANATVTTSDGTTYSSSDVSCSID